MKEAFDLPWNFATRLTSVQSNLRSLLDDPEEHPLLNRVRFDGWKVYYDEKIVPKELKERPDREILNDYISRLEIDIYRLQQSKKY